jgi:hypothetical protein
LRGRKAGCVDNEARGPDMNKKKHLSALDLRTPKPCISGHCGARTADVQSRSGWAATNLDGNAILISVFSRVFPKLQIQNKNQNNSNRTVTVVVCGQQSQNQI